MADDAGFAVALTIRQRLLNDGILVAYAGDSFPRTLSHDLLGPPAASIDVFLAPPQITCKADNTLTVAVQMWGSLSVTMTDVKEAEDVAARLTLRIQPSFVVKGSNLELQFNDVVNEVTATGWDFVVISGSGFSPAADSYLRSNAFRDRLQLAMQLAISSGLVQLPKIDIRFLGKGILAAVKDMVAQSRVVGGALLLGLDIDTVNVAGDDLTTTGDVNQLADFARDNDIAAVTNAVAVPVLLQEVQSKVSDQVGQSGATLERLQITAQAGRFHVEGRASNSDGTANFSFNLIPALYASKPGTNIKRAATSPPQYMMVKTRVWPALGFTIADSQVDVDPDAWFAIISVVAAWVIDPVVFLVVSLIVFSTVFSMANEAAGNLNADIASVPAGVPAPRVQHLKLSKPRGLTMRVKVADFEITTLGTYVGITFRPQAPPGALIGFTSIPSDFRAELLSYTVRLPIEVQSDDPKLRIRWTVIDTSGTVLVNEDGFAKGRETFTIVPDSIGPGLSELGVGVRVYRALGAQITDFLNDSLILNVRGPLPPGAYVRWPTGTLAPQVVFDERNQTWHYAGELVVKRHSNLHRTDQPCANTFKRSRFAPPVETFDALPFPLADIALHRSELCDYCFYGGPAGIRPSL